MTGKEIVRKIDVSAGHCFSPRAASSWSADVFANEENVVRQFDTYPTHCCGPLCHGGVISGASQTVFVNNLGIARTGDAHSCGDRCGAHSPNVFAGG